MKWLQVAHVEEEYLNIITDPEARLVEDAFARRLAELGSGSEPSEDPTAPATGSPGGTGDEDDHRRADMG